jgi:hypothetical protein
MDMRDLQDYALLPVPVELVPRVAAMIRDLVQQDVSVAGLDSQTLGAGTSWREAELRALADHMSYRGVLVLMDMCAETPSSWVLKADAEDRAGVSAIQLRNELGAFSKTVRRLFGDASWPMEVRKQAGQFYYRMSDEVAAAWAAVRGEASR